MKTYSRMLLFMLPLCLAFLLVSIVPADAGSGGGGAHVINVPPTFKHVEFDVKEDNAYLRLEILDTNGAWGSNGDLMRVTVEIFNADGDVRASASFQQYENTSSTITINRFSDGVGSSLRISLCNVTRPSTNPETNPDVELARSELDMTFAFKPLDEGSKISITVYDRTGAYSEVIVPYSDEPQYYVATRSKAAVAAVAAVSAGVAGVVTTYVSFIKPKK